MSATQTASLREGNHTTPTDHDSASSIAESVNSHNTSNRVSLSSPSSSCMSASSSSTSSIPSLQFLATTLLLVDDDDKSDSSGTPPGSDKEQYTVHDLEDISLDSAASKAPSQITTMTMEENAIIDNVLALYRRSCHNHDHDHTPEQATTTVHARDYLQQFRAVRPLTEAPLGLIGLSMYLKHWRQDWEWSQDAAARHERGWSALSWKEYKVRHKHGRQQLLLDTAGKRRKTPPTRICWFTLFVVIMSTALQITSFALNGWKTAPFRANPMLGPSVQVAVDMGALDPVRMLDEDEWYRLVTAIFLHAGLLHLILNMVVVWFLGRSVEKTHGTLRTAYIFLVSGVGGNLTSALLAPHGVSVGSSGGIFGLLGVWMADVWNHWDVLVRMNPNFPLLRCLLWLILDLAVNFSVGLTIYVDNFCHLGGFVFGFLLGTVMIEATGQTESFVAGCSTSEDLFWQRLCTQSFKMLFLLVAIVLGCTMLGILLSSRNNEDGPPEVCPWCHHLNCVPFPFWTENKWWECDGCEWVSARGLFNKEGDLTGLDVLCPNDETVTVYFGDVHMTIKEARNELVQYCRSYCTS